MTVSDSALAERFSEHRDHLLGVAYRLTGTRSDAEDAIQEAWLRLSAVDTETRDGIRDLRAWLTTVVGRLCLDRLRSATARRERYVGPWLPEPLVTPFGTAASEDPLDVAVRDDGVRIAALLVLDQLSPEQRVAFVLHDAFDLPFADIAATLGCTDATARQHASRARKAMAKADPPQRVALPEQRELIERFVAALASGDLAQVVTVLHPDAVLVGDSGGKARTARQHILGPDKIGRFFLGLLRQYGPGAMVGEIITVNGDLGIYLPEAQPTGTYQGGPRSRRVTTFAVRDGKIAAIYDMVNPDKLTRVDL
ncbi:sigma-70 family RNA polymerase sigma factor [Actinokineospora sp. NBRC 105648]|uniref:sigma-70 family RNA polymerase sigma factor n=1 Tax=Actinokineospora sp. NBRC 105648 TaxID=3032206 RepID=UPI0024A4FC84|nr:sigma-70 family RNA polymerase sigma factor [Actinokineospora sp. NBRC 105648]GLZ39585.1 RNA polymerase sigma factor SigJ [Actinokineospora sp. NBRC 105648]